jgi:hypothetical protein
MSGTSRPARVPSNEALLSSPGLLRLYLTLSYKNICISPYNKSYSHFLKLVIFVTKFRSHFPLHILPILILSNRNTRITGKSGYPVRVRTEDPIKKRMDVLLDREVYNTLTVLALCNDMPKSAVIRAAILEYAKLFPDLPDLHPKPRDI